MRNTPAETKERDTGWRLSKLGVVVVQWVAVVVVNPPKPRDWAKTLLYILTLYIVPVHRSMYLTSACEYFFQYVHCTVYMHLRRSMFT